MKIIVDREGESIIKQFSDLALRAGGLQNLNMVQVVLQSMKVELPTLVDKQPKSGLQNLNEVKEELVKEVEKKEEAEKPIPPENK